MEYYTHKDELALAEVLDECIKYVIEFEQYKDSEDLPDRTHYFVLFDPQLVFQRIREKLSVYSPEKRLILYQNLDFILDKKLGAYMEEAFNDLGSDQIEIIYGYKDIGSSMGTLMDLVTYHMTDIKLEIDAKSDTPKISCNYKSPYDDDEHIFEGFKKEENKTIEKKEAKEEVPINNFEADDKEEENPKKRLKKPKKINRLIWDNSRDSLKDLFEKLFNDFVDDFDFKELDHHFKIKSENGTSTPRNEFTKINWKGKLIDFAYFTFYLQYKKFIICEERGLHILTVKHFKVQGEDKNAHNIASSLSEVRKNIRLGKTNNSVKIENIIKSVFKN